MAARPDPRADRTLAPPVPLRPVSRPFTVDDLPGRAGGRRVELVDGVLLVGPGVAAPHQRAARRLARALEPACHRPLEVFSPFTLRLADDTEVVPDVAVVAVEDPLPRYPRDARLVAEVLSPRSRRTDVALKGRVYADAGVPVFVVVDPDAVTVEVHELRGGGYLEVARAARAEELEVPEPLRVRISPAELVRP